MLNTEAEHNQHNYYSESKRIKIKDDLMDMFSSSSNNIPIQPGNLKYNSDLTRWGHIYEVFDGNSTNAVFIVKKGTKDQVGKAFKHYNKNKDNQNVNNYLMDFVLYIDQKGSIKNEEDTISEWMSEYEKVGYFPDEVKTELGILTTSTYNDDKEDTNHDVSIGSNSNRKKPKTREEEAYDFYFAQAKRIEENVKWIDAEIKKVTFNPKVVFGELDDDVKSFIGFKLKKKSSELKPLDYIIYLDGQLEEAENKLKEAENKLEKAKIELKEANERMDKANSRLDNLQTASATTISNFDNILSGLDMEIEKLKFPNFEDICLLPYENKICFDKNLCREPGQNKFPCFLLHEIKNFSDQLSNYPIGSTPYIILAPSGAGKTRSLFRLMLSRIGFYLIYKNAGDKNYGSTALSNIVEALSNLPIMKMSNPSGDDFVKRRKIAEVATTCVLYSYMFIFINWYKKISANANLNLSQIPEKWLYLQLFPVQFLGGDPFELYSQMLFKVYEKSNFSNDFGDIILKKATDTRHDIDNINVSNSTSESYPCCFAIDEAQLLTSGPLEKAFKTTSIVNRRNSAGIRPLLSPVLSAITRVVGRHPIISGTGLTLMKEWKSIESAMAVEEWKNVIAKFDMFDEVKTKSILLRYLGQAANNISSDWLCGRPRFVFSFIERVLNQYQNQNENTDLEKLLNNYVEKMTEIIDSSQNEPRTPGAAIFRLGSKEAPINNIFGNITEINYFEFLKDTLHISCGSTQAARCNPRLLELGLGYALPGDLVAVQKTESIAIPSAQMLSFPKKELSDSFSSTSTNREWVPLIPIIIEPENLILEAACKARNDNFFIGALKYFQQNASSFGTFFEFPSALLLQKYFGDNSLEKIIPSEFYNTIPSEFKKQWKPFERICGMYCKPNSFKKDNKNIYDWFDSFKSGSTEKKYPIIYPGDLDGPDICLAFYADHSVLFIIIQVKTTEKQDINSAAVTVDPAQFNCLFRNLTEKDLNVKLDEVKLQISKIKNEKMEMEKEKGERLDYLDMKLKCLKNRLPVPRSISYEKQNIELLKNLENDMNPVIRIIFSGNATVMQNVGSGNSSSAEEPFKLIPNGRKKGPKFDLQIIFDLRNIKNVFGQEFSNEYYNLKPI